MGFWTKKPDPPPITNEAEYIAWFVEYGEELAPLRALHKHDITTFVRVCVKGAMKEIAPLHDGDAMFARVGDLAVAYETRIKPMVDKRGGLRKCPSELYGAAASLIVNILVLSELLKKKYEHPEAVSLFESVKDVL